jgi:hypothetical protein
MTSRNKHLQCTGSIVVQVYAAAIYEYTHVRYAMFLVAARLVKLSQRSEFLSEFLNETIYLTRGWLAYGEVGKHGILKQIKSNAQVRERVI